MKEEPRNGARFSCAGQSMQREFFCAASVKAWGILYIYMTDIKAVSHMPAACTHAILQKPLQDS